MKKTTKKIYTLKDAIEKIPHDEYYCNDSGECPFWKLRELTKTKYKRLVEEGKLTDTPCWYARGNKWKAEYCSWLKEYLSIQDGIKDCCINEYYDGSKDITFNRVIGPEVQKELQELYPEEFGQIKKEKESKK